MTTVAVTLLTALPIINGCIHEFELSGAVTLTVTCVPDAVVAVTAGVIVTLLPEIPNCVRTAFAAVVAPALVCPGVVAERAPSYAADVKRSFRKIAFVASIDPNAITTRIGRQKASSTVAVPLRFRRARHADPPRLTRNMTHVLFQRN